MIKYASVISDTLLDKILFDTIPKIKAHATVRISTAPILNTSPPTPVMRIIEETNIFLLFGER